MKRFILLLTVVFFQIVAKAQSSETINAKAEAKRIASLCMKAMGGLNQFNSTNYIGWNFFGHRRLIWDKIHKRVRIDFIKSDITIISELESSYTKLFINDIEISDADSLKKYSEKAKSIWRNDSYWLVMPFKLFDPGVFLEYIGIEKSSDSTDAYKLQLTFGENIGETPQNKYYIFIDMKTYLVKEWMYFQADGLANPTLQNVWTDYRQYGSIQLSSGRGERGNLSEIHVWRSLPDSVFEKAGKINFNTL